MKLFPAVQGREKAFMLHLPSSCKNFSGQLKNSLPHDLIIQPKLFVLYFNDFFSLFGVKPPRIYRDQECTLSVFVLQAK